MERLFASRNSAIKLKELGFDEPCVAFYSSRGQESLEFGQQSDYWGDSTGFQKRDFRLEKPFEMIIGAPLWQQVFEFIANYTREKRDELCDYTEIILLSNGEYSVLRIKPTDFGYQPETVTTTSKESLQYFLDIIENNK